jgi:antitoxin ParD1/3/4
MATMNVSLPDKMKDWVEAQAESGRYTDTSDYVRDLIRRDQERAEAFAELKQLIDEGLESGISDKTPEDIRQEVLREYYASLERGEEPFQDMANDAL